MLQCSDTAMANDVRWALSLMLGEKLEQVSVGLLGTRMSLAFGVKVSLQLADAIRRSRVLGWWVWVHGEQQ